MANRPCPVLGVHNMEPAARPGSVINKEGENILNKYDFAQHSQCTGCDTHFICSGFPSYNPPWPIGYYASGVTILAGMGGATGGVWVEVDENYIRYTDSAYLEGYNFPKT